MSFAVAMTAFTIMASLVFDSGPRTGEKVPLDRDKITFGRGKSCDCVLAHPTVSREHFYIEHNNGKLFLVDQGSENGTRANDKRISWVELEDGDEIKAGPFTLVFEIDERRGEPTGAPGRTQSADNDGETVEASTFDATTSGMYAPQYLQGIEHFNAGRYFDAHEVWEEIWLHSSDETKIFYQMLIQAAVGLHHYERGNMRGAQGMHANVVEKLGRLPAVFLSLDLVEFASMFNNALAGLIAGNDDVTLPAEKPRPQIRLLSSDTTDWNL